MSIYEIVGTIAAACVVIGSLIKAISILATMRADIRNIKDNHLKGLKEDLERLDAKLDRHFLEGHHGRDHY